MKIKRLQINSFRKIRDLTIDFDVDQPIVLIGINGVGKSSILDCLAILLCRYTESLLKLLEISEEQELTSGFPTQFSRTLRPQDVQNGAQETFLEILVEFDFNEIFWNLSRNLQSASKKPVKRSVKELEALVRKLVDQLKVNPDFNLPLIVFYSVNRSVFDVSSSSEGNVDLEKKYFLSEQVIAYINALAERRVDFDLFVEWFKNQEDLENELRLKDPSYRNPLLEAVRRAIEALPPRFTNLHIQRSGLKGLAASAMLSRTGKVARMFVTKQGIDLDINQLSDGEKGLLALVGDLARRLAIANPSLPNPLEGEGIVLIDEVELHLHPNWQRWVVPGLQSTFPNCQFILTTHSPQVISEVKGNVYGLKETTPGNLVIRKVDAYGKDSNRILEDIMEDAERPYDIKEELLELFRRIDQGDIEGARQLRRELAEEIGADEPEFAKADILIRRREILNR
jgi:predicted ATP-binding protein involved in virulence